MAIKVSDDWIRTRFFYNRKLIIITAKPLPPSVASIGLTNNNSWNSIDGYAILHVASNKN